MLLFMDDKMICKYIFTTTRLRYIIYLDVFGTHKELRIKKARVAD